MIPFLKKLIVNVYECIEKKIGKLGPFNDNS